MPDKPVHLAAAPPDVVHPPAPLLRPAAPRRETLEEKRRRIVSALEKCGWVQAKAARLLKMTPRQIGYAIQQLEIEVQRL
ncbi:MAG: hypothetical protein HGA47_11130 [Zoogloea sp.]|nr:hypothetical protein [Zoogloea sp.]